MKLIECRGSHNIYKVMKENEDVSDKEIVANSVDAAVEKHVPQYEIKEDMVEIVVNHVMEEEHLIEWIMVEYEDLEMTKYFKAFDKVVFEAQYIPGMKIYAYCNKHGLWMNKID